LVIEINQLEQDKVSSNDKIDAYERQIQRLKGEVDDLNNGRNEIGRRYKEK
jgi:cell division protein FtsB